MKNEIIWKRENGESKMWFEMSEGYLVLHVFNQNGPDWHLINKDFDMKFELDNVYNCYNITFGDYKNDKDFITSFGKIFLDYARKNFDFGF